jgi:hypothetical protein
MAGALAILISALVFRESVLHGEGSNQTQARPPHGFAYHHDEIPEGPWSVHIVKLDRANADLELQTTLPKGSQIGLATLSDQVKATAPRLGRPVAAINGDYYNKNRPYVGDPKGLQILDGELISGPCDWTCLWIDAAGQPHMTNVVSRFEVTWPDGTRTPLGLNEERPRNAAVLYTAAIGGSTRTSGGRELVLERNGTNDWLPLRIGQTYSARVREVRPTGDSPVAADTMVLSLGRPLEARAQGVAPGAVLKISTATLPNLKGARMAIGGGPPIVRDGKDIARTEIYVRHPRAAIGWNDDYFFLVEVDGRQRRLSVGMTLPELADYMIKLGCKEALNLDGGGSATFWVYGQLMNSPSEGRERAMANSIVLIQKGSR